jgi:hypothetical protein
MLLLLLPWAWNAKLSRLAWLSALFLLPSVASPVLEVDALSPNELPMLAAEPKESPLVACARLSRA